MVREGRSTWLRSWLLASTFLMAALAAGCAKVNPKPAAPSGRTGQQAAPAVAPPAPPVEEPAPRLSVSSIVRHDLQNGRYAEGGAALRQYLRAHPGDRAAQFFLKQLTEDPKQALGAAANPHVVQPGESYSTLAAKYLGDPNLFVVLARYNNSPDPAVIRVGSTLQMPAFAQVDADVAGAGTSGKEEARAPDAPPVLAAPSPQQAVQMERQSLALYRQGQHEKAIALFDQALTLNPQLKSSDPDFPALRKAWVATSHQQAMVLYLDQHLDQAIALWNRILFVDPGYEPAVVYRTRALELKQRLQQY